jgi:hypothetical protein
LSTVDGRRSHSSSCSSGRTSCIDPLLGPRLAGDACSRAPEVLR